MVLGERDRHRDRAWRAPTSRAINDCTWRWRRNDLPLAEARLTPEDWSGIKSDLVTERDPLFGDRVEAEFEGLRKRLLAWEEECRTI